MKKVSLFNLISGIQIVGVIEDRNDNKIEVKNPMVLHTSFNENENKIDVKFGKFDIFCDSNTINLNDCNLICDPEPVISKIAEMYFDLIENNDYNEQKIESNKFNESDELDEIESLRNEFIKE